MPHPLRRIAAFAIFFCLVGVASPQITKDADGLNVEPACFAKDHFSEYAEDEGIKPTGVTASHPAYALEIYTRISKSSRAGWRLVGERADGRRCFLDSGFNGYPHTVREQPWFQRYFGGDVFTMATGPIDFKPHDFLGFAGFRYADNDAHVRRLLGEPSDVEKYSQDTRFAYADGSVTVNVANSNGRIRMISVKGQKGVLFLMSRKLSDRKLNFLGRPRDDFLEAWKPAERAGKHSLQFQSQSGLHRVQVNVDCRADGRCDEMTVFWYE